MADVKLRVGDDLIVDGLYKDENGDPVDLTVAGITITSAVLAQDESTRYELTVTPADQTTNPGEYTITGDTSEWTPGRALKWNVRYTNTADESWSTDCFTIELDISPTP